MLNRSVKHFYDAIYRDHPTLAFDLTWLAAQEEQILDEHLLSIGRRTALEIGKQMVGPGFREGGMFGPERPCPDSAPADQRILAFAGREV